MSVDNSSASELVVRFSNASLTLGAGDDSIAVANTETVNLGDGDDLAVVTGDNLAHQTDVVKLAGTIETGDVYTVTVNATKVSYRVEDGDSIAEVRAGLIDALNAGASDAVIVTAGDVADEIVIRAGEAGVQKEFQINTYTCLLYTSPSPRD